MGLFSGSLGFLKDVVTGDWTNAGNRVVGDNVSNAVSNAFDVGNALNINELKSSGWIPNELNNPTGAGIVAGGALLGPGSLTSLAGGAGSAINGVLGGVGLGGVSSALGSGIGAATGMADALLGGAAGLIGTGVNAVAGNPLLLGIGAGKLLQGFGGNGSSPNPTAVSAGGAPTYDKTLLDAFNAQLAIEPQLLKANQLYQPQWLALQAQNQQQTAQSQLDLMKSLYPQAGQMEAAYQNQLRQNELQQISGPNNALQQYQNAFNALTPGVQGAITNTGLLAQGAMGRALYQPEFSSYEQGVPNPYQAAQIAAMQGMPISSMYGGRQMMPAYPGIQPQQFQQQPLQLQMPQPGTEAYYNMVPDARPGAGLPRDDGNVSQPSVGVGSQSPVVNGQLDLSGSAGAVKLQPNASSALAGLNLPQAGPTAPIGQPSAPIAAPAPAAPQSQFVQTGATTGGYGANLAPRADMAMAVPAQQPSEPAVSPPAVVQQPIQQPAQVQPPIRPMQPQGWQMAFNRYRQPQAEDVVGTLGRQAMTDLSAGRSLTPEEQRIADQTARSAYAARGTALGNQAIGAEILNRADVANQRYMQRQQSASGIASQMAALQNQQFNQGLAGAQFGLGAQQQQYAQAMGTQQSAFQQALNKSQADIQRAQAAQQLQAGQAQLGAGALAQLQNYQTPILQAFYKQSIMPNTVPQAQTMGMANQQAAGNSLFNVESPMAFQSAFLPYQGGIALQSAQLQANAAKNAGQNSMFGNLGGSLIQALPMMASAFCWVAREVYGTKTGTWKVFRSWMLTQAPAWFRNLYIKHGEHIAAFISDKPALKAIIRRWMDSKIKIHLGA